MEPKPQYPPQPQAEVPPEPPVAPKPSKKRGFVWLLISLLIIAGLLAGSYAAYRHKTGSTLLPITAKKQSVTLYYSDGKTVLWQGTTPAVEPTAGNQPTKAPYFVDLVRAELHQKFGDSYYRQGAWDVTTTLDASLQASAEKLVADNLPNVMRASGDQEATILEDVPTGQIKALVGGVDRTNPNYGLLNFATNIRIQPGSSIQPFTYAAYIDNSTNVGAGTVVSDTQAPLPGYPCTNKGTPTSGGNCLQDYDFAYPGDMPLRYALGGQRNVPAVRTTLSTTSSQTDNSGTQKVIDTVNKMGADSGYNCYPVGTDIYEAKPSDKSQCYSSAVLGDGAFITLADETHAVSTLANNGKKVTQTTIYAVKLNGKLKSGWQQPAGQQILKPDTAYIINDIMSDPSASYLPGSCDATNCTASANGGYKFQRYNGWKFAVDPGTSNSGYNAVMASWSSQYAVVSWVGHHTETVAIKGFPETVTSPLTYGLMAAAHTGKTPVAWVQPTDIKTLPAYVLTKHIHYGDIEPSPATDIYPGWYTP